MDRFKSGQTNDPRGKHWCIYNAEIEGRRPVYARDFNKENIDQLLPMFNSGMISPDYYSRTIGSEVRLHLPK